MIFTIYFVENIPIIWSSFNTSTSIKYIPMFSKYFSNNVSYFENVVAKGFYCFGRLKDAWVPPFAPAVVLSTFLLLYVPYNLPIVFFYGYKSTKKLEKSNVIYFSLPVASLRYHLFLYLSKLSGTFLNRSFYFRTCYVFWIRSRTHSSPYTAISA